MRTDIKAHRVILRREAIEKALVDAAIKDEHDLSGDRYGLQAYWFEDRLPSEVTVFLVPKPAPKTTKAA